MTNPLDPRRNAYRPDLADIRLKGRVSAGRFVAGTDRVVTRPAVSLKKAPDPACGSETEALFGELFRVLEETGDGWSWGQLAGDGYVGWIETLALAAPGPAATHRVSALRTFRYPRPDMKTPPLGFLSFASLVSVKAEAGRFVEIADGSFVVARHLAPLAEFEPDFVAVAERFLGTPYLWGGKSSLGLDCSGLVQVSMAAAGLGCPRDSDMQAAEAGVALDISAGLPPLCRGDLVFWRGHVGIMRDTAELIHANAFHMAVASEPLAGAIARIAADGLPVTAVRRIAAIA